MYPAWRQFKDAFQKRAKGGPSLTLDRTNGGLMLSALCNHRHGHLAVLGPEVPDGQLVQLMPQESRDAVSDLSYRRSLRRVYSMSRLLGLRVERRPQRGEEHPQAGPERLGRPIIRGSCLCGILSKIRGGPPAPPGPGAAGAGSRGPPVHQGEPCRETPQRLRGPSLTMIWPRCWPPCLPIASSPRPALPAHPRRRLPKVRGVVRVPRDWCMKRLPIPLPYRPPL